MKELGRCALYRSWEGSPSVVSSVHKYCHSLVAAGGPRLARRRERDRERRAGEKPEQREQRLAR